MFCKHAVEPAYYKYKYSFPGAALLPPLALLKLRTQRTVVLLGLFKHPPRTGVTMWLQLGCKKGPRWV